MLHQKYQPKDLDDIVGQPALRQVKAHMKRPHGKCFMLVGPGGTGKTAAAHAIARQLGCNEEFGGGLWRSRCSDLNVEDARSLFKSLRMARSVKVLILEELEWVHPQVQRLLKDTLDPLGDMPSNLVVVATSNDTSALDPNMLQRFEIVKFIDKAVFAVACQKRLAEMWAAETDRPLPMSSRNWGKTDGGYSMRVAITEMETALLEGELLCA